MSALTDKLEALLKDEMTAEARVFLDMAIAVEKGDFKCSQCGKTSIQGAHEEGDDWWCLACMNQWEAKHGQHWEDGTPL